MAGKKVKFEITAKDKTAAAFKSVTSRLGKMNKATAKLIGNVAKVAAALAAIGAGVVIAGLTNAVAAASRLQEVTGKFDTVFKNLSGKAKVWAEELVESYAMSTREAREYLSSVQDLLVPMGMAEDKAGGMALSITKLAADLGSFNNKSTEKVMEDIQSALTGSYETMKKYGIVLSAASIEQKVFAMGLASTKEAITPAMKAQAAYKMMMEGSTAALGDMARTQDSYANQVKQLSANWEEFIGIIGQEFLPYATQVVSAINAWFKANKDLIKQKAAEWAKRLAEWARKGWEEISRLVVKLREWYVQNESIVDSGLIDFLYGLKAVASAVWTVFQKVGQAIGYVAAQIVTLIDKILQLDSVKATIEFFGKASPARPLSETIDAVQGKFAGMADQINSAKIGTTVGLSGDMSSAIFSRLMDMNQKTAFAQSGVETYGAANIGWAYRMSAKKQRAAEMEGMREIMEMMGGFNGGGGGQAGGVTVNIDNAFGDISDITADKIAAALNRRGYQVGG